MIVNVASFVTVTCMQPFILAHDIITILIKNVSLSNENGVFKIKTLSESFQTPDLSRSFYPIQKISGCQFSKKKYAAIVNKKFIYTYVCVCL